MSNGQQYTSAISADTDAATLYQFTQERPDLWVDIINHPNVYPDLLDWFDGMDDPTIKGAVAARRAADSGESATPQPQRPAAPLQPSAPAQPPAQPAAQPVAQQQPAAPAQPQAPARPSYPQAQPEMRPEEMAPPAGQAPANLPPPQAARAVPQRRPAFPRREQAAAQPSAPAQPVQPVQQHAHAPQTPAQPVQAPQMQAPVQHAQQAQAQAAPAQPARDMSRPPTSPSRVVSQRRKATQSQSQPAQTRDTGGDEMDERTLLAKRKRVPYGELVLPSGEVIPLTHRTVLVGRRLPESAKAPWVQAIDIPDETKTISSLHAKLSYGEGMWIIEDLNSTNGIYVVDEEGRETELKGVQRLNSPFYLGDVLLSVRSERNGA